MLFSDFVEIYLKDMETRLREHTMIGKRYAIEQKIIPYFGKRRLSDIKAVDIRKWQNELMKKDYAPTYLRAIQNQLNAIFNYAIKYYDLPSNPCLKAGSMGKKHADEMQFWTKEEYLKFSEVMMDKPISYYAFEILYWCGIREGELLALTPEDFDFDYIFGELGVRWLHTGGIYAALSEQSCETVLAAIKAAKKLGLTVSFDPNFRSTLWSFETARDVLSRYLPYVDVLIGIEPIHVYNADGTDVKDGLTMDPSFEDMDRVFKAIDEQYHMKAIARTVRYVHSGSNNSLKAFYYADGKTYESKTLNFEIVDRVGGGDAFSSGLIYALMQNDWKHEDIVNFAVASSVMKHAIRGDTNITSVDQIKRLMNNASFDVQR